MTAAQRLSVIVWSVAVASALAWLGIASVYDRYSTHSRYSGMGIIAVIWFGAVPLAALVFALGHSCIASARTPLAYLSLACGAFVILVFAGTVVSGEASLSQRRDDERQREDQRVALEAEVEALSLTELTALSSSDDLVRSGVASRIGLQRLAAETSCDNAGRAAELAAALKAFVARADLVLSISYDVVKHSCEALRPALSDAFVAGVVLRGDRETAYTITQLFDIDGSGALLARVVKAKPFAPETQAAAVLEEIAKRTPDGIRRARKLIAIGVSPASGDPLLSLQMKDIQQERNEAWPEAASNDELELYRTIVAAEKKRH